MLADREFLGFGLGLRKEHYQIVLEEKPAVDWFEIISENYMVPGGRALHNLDRIREYYPMVMHGVSMSIGSTDPLNMDYLKELKKLIQRVQPVWVSDHLCWTGNAHFNMHDLLPLPYSEETIQHVVEQIKQVQDYLNQQLVIENLSSYLTYTHSEMTEWEFMSEIAQRSDSLILLDVNNVYVSSRNHQFEPLDYIKGLPHNRIQQIHLAGHRDLGDYVIDTHDEPICDEVWVLYEQTARLIGPVSTMIERDDDIPELPILLQELDHVRHIGESVWREAAA